eukprot:NODE_306_length_11344_cov_0.675767.p4 type:complete len:271 gc:universal NODE_306_length_11344_cov_0.675767:5179-5991(+)
MVLKVRSVAKSPKSYGFKLGMPQAKFRKTPGSNIRSQAFADARGPPVITSKNTKLSKGLFEFKSKVKVPKDQFISAKEWQFYLGDIVEVVKGRLVDPKHKTFSESSMLLPANRQGKVIEMDYSRNLLRVEGIYKSHKKYPASPFMKTAIADLHHYIPYSDLAIVDPTTKKPTDIVWKRMPRKNPEDVYYKPSPADLKGKVWKRVATGTNAIIPLPDMHKNRNLKDEDNTSDTKAKKSAYTCTSADINTSFNSKNKSSDIHADCQVVRGHY